MDSAVLVIDMQNGFCDPDAILPRSGYGMPDIAMVVATIGELLDAGRDVGIPVVYTRHVYQPGLVDATPRSRQMMSMEPAPLIVGTWEVDVLPSLAPHPGGDLVVDKNRYDAFLNTGLEAALRERGIGQLLVTGVLTNVCVESSVRSAEQLGFDVLVAADCTTAFPGYVEPSLAAMAAVFARVGPWREMLDIVEVESRSRDERLPRGVSRGR